MSVLGSVMGLAYGDSVGKEVEFTSYRSIVRRHGKRGPKDLARGGLVTDDTQMMLAVGEALVGVRQLMARRQRINGGGAGTVLRPADVRQALVNRFINWYHDPENTRAPGGTCLQACRGLSAGTEWWVAASKQAKGCGANMRVTPVGLCNWLSEEQRSMVAQAQAALTHAHPTALAAADATQHAVWLLAHGDCPSWELLDELSLYCQRMRGVWHEEWFGMLWAWTRVDASPEAYLARGWDEVERALDRVATALDRGDHGGDLCDRAGQAWVAEEALAAALLAFLWHPEDPVRAIRRGATTNGDSDSIAAIAGALAGAYYPASEFPSAWEKGIEYRDRLETMAVGLA